MDPEFQKNLDILLDDDREFLYPNWIRSATFFFDLAKKKKEIELALPGLERVYFASHQLPVMRPAIGAILKQLLKQKNSERIEFLMKDKESSVWVIEALETVAAKGTDIETAVRSVVRHFGDSQFAAAKILAYQVRYRKKSEVLTNISDAFVNEKGSEIFLINFLRQVIEFGVDVTPALPYVALLLDNPQIKNRVISSFSWIAGKNLKLSKIENRMKMEIHETAPENTEQIAYYLSLFYLTKKENPEEKLSSSLNLSSVRLGILRAFGYVLLVYKNKSAYLIDNIALSLIDENLEVRTRAIEILKNSLTLTKKVTPSLDVLEKLVSGLVFELTRTFISEYLVDLGGQQKKNALIILKIIKDRNLSNITQVSELYETLDPKGDIPTDVCSICRNLPRIESWNNQYSLPPELKKLKELDPTVYPRLRQCPECGNYYEESYEVDTEDMRTRESFTWQRLQTAEIIDMLVGDEKKNFVSQLEPYLQNLKLKLNHPNPFQSSDSGWKLAHYYLSIVNITEIENLSSHKNLKIREELFQAMSDNIEKANFSPYQSLLEKGIKDSSPIARKNAAQAFAKFNLDSNNVENLETLLLSHDSEILSGALTSVYRYVLKPNICPYPEIITRMVTHENQNVRRLATWIHEKASEQGQVMGSLLDTLIIQISDQNKNIRNDAMVKLETIAPCEKKEIIIQTVSKWIGDPHSNYYAISLLTRYASDGVNISSAIPFVIKQINLTGRSGDLLGLLQISVTAGNFHPEMISIGVAGLRDYPNKYRACDLLKAIADAGVDMEPAVEGINSYLADTGGADSYSESMIRLLIKHFHKKENNDAIIRLTRNPNTSHRISAAYGILYLMDKGLDFVPLLQSIEENLTDRSSQVKEQSEKIIRLLKAKDNPL